MRQFDDLSKTESHFSTQILWLIEQAINGSCWPISEAPEANSRVRLSRVQRPLGAYSWAGGRVPKKAIPLGRGARGNVVRMKRRKGLGLKPLDWKFPAKSSRGLLWRNPR
jgi:hypothetical protein